MKNNLIYNKAFEFSVKIVNLHKYLRDNRKEYTMSKQLLKSGTSIGANISESLKAQSSNDFLSKMYIAFKEAGETEYWLKLLYETKYIPKGEAVVLLNDIEEILRIISKIIKTKKENLEKI